MKKRLLIAFALALCVPWAMKAQNCTQTIPFFEGFESTAAVTSYTTAGDVPTCWNVFSSGTSAGYAPHVVTGTGSYVYYKTGSNGLVFTASTSATNGPRKYLVLPPMNVPLNQLQLSFWMCPESVNYGIITVGYLTSDDTSTYTVIATYPTSMAIAHSGNGLQVGTGLDVELVLSSVPANATRLALRYEHSTSSTTWSCCIDDVALDYIPSCPKVENVSFVPSTTSATVSWHETGSATLWEVVVTDADGVVVSTDEVNDTTDIIYNLTPNSLYEVSVRAICTTGDTSIARSATFRTLCVDLTSADLPYTYGFEDATGSGAAYEIDQCWSRHYLGGSTRYPNPSTTQKHTGAYALYFYNSTTVTKNWATLPQLDATVDASTLSVGLWVLKTSATGGKLKVGVMTDPNSSNTFTEIQQIQPTQNNTWQYFEIPLTSYTGTGAYVTLMGDTNGTNAVYVDDVTLMVTPTCAHPAAATIANIGAYGATVNITDPTNVGTYLIQVTGDSTFSETVYDTTYTFTDLQPNSVYSVAVSAICPDGNPTAAAMVQFRTDCVPIVSLPWNEGFEGIPTGSASSTSFVPCMNRLNGTTSYYPFVSSTASYVHTGSQALYWYCPVTTGTYQCMVLPPVDTDMVAMNTIQLRFWARATVASYAPVLQVGVMSDPNDINTFQLVQNVNVVGTTYTAYTVAMGTFTGNGQYVAIRATPGSAAWYITMDDLTLEPMPNCPPVINIAATPTVGSARLTWDVVPGFDTPDSYEVSYDTLGGSDPTVLYPTTNSVILTGLAPATTYKVYIQANCDGDNGTMDSLTFTTSDFECLTLNPATADTVQIGSGTTTTYYVPIGNYFHYSYTQQLVSASEMNGAAVLTGIDFDYGYGTAMTSKNNVTIYLANTTTTSLASAFVPYSAAFVPVYTGNLNCHQGWNHFEFDTPFSYDGTSNLLIVIHDNSDAYDGTSYTFKAHSATGKARYVQNDSNPYDINNITGGTSYANRVNMKLYSGECMTTAICAAPAVEVMDATTTSVELAWVPGYDETSWDVDYRVAGTTEWTNSTTSLSTTSYTVEGLTPGTDYEFRVSFTCNDDANTLYSAVVTARTPCVAVSVPYSYGFEDMPTGTSTARPDIRCWHHLNDGTQYFGYPYVSSTTPHSGARDLYWYHTTTTGTYGNYQAVVLPQVDVNTNPINTLQLSFWAKNGSTSYSPELQVGVMTDPEDISTFELVQTIRVSNANTDWNFYDAFLDSYTGNGSYIAVRFVRPSSSMSVYTDDFTIDVIPTCRHITNLRVDTVTENSVTLQWHPKGTESMWSVSDGSHYFVAYDTTYTVTGLDANTPYTFEVRALCTSEDSSMAWSVNTRTACTQYLSLPYSEDFEGYTTSTTAATGVHVSCWDYLMTGTSTYQAATYQPQLYYYVNTSSYVYNHSGNYSLRLYGVGNTCLPQLPVTANNVSMSFWAKHTATASALVVGVMTDPQVDSTFDTIQVINYTSTAYADPLKYFEIDFSSYTGTGRYIAFRNTGSTTTSTNYIDDIEVWQNSTCVNPVVNVAEVTHNTATVTWFDTTGVGYNGAYIYWNTRNNFATAQNTFVSTGNTCTITGLTPETDYYVWIAGSCGTETSRPIRLQLTTAGACAPIEHLTVSGVDYNSFGISWSAPETGYAASRYVVYMRQCTNTPYSTSINWIIDTTANTYYSFTGLAEGTTYAYAVRTLCGSDEADYLGGYVTTTICQMDTVGNYNVNYNAQPIYNSQAYAYTQNIYLASELQGIDSINSLAFYQRGYNYNDRNITVYLGETSMDEFAATSDFVPASRLTQVYSGRLGGFGWLNLNFDQTFVRHADSNLVVAVVDNTGAAYTANTCYWACTKYENPNIYRSIHYYGSNPITAAAPSGSSARDSYRAFVVFGNAACERPVCATPIVMQTSATADRVDIAWNNIAGTSYTVEYRATGATAWTLVNANNTTGVDSITGLGGAFAGEVRVSYGCDGETVSGTSPIYTLCGPAALPLTEDFELQDYGTYNRACWKVGSTYFGETNPLPNVTSLTGSDDKICHFQQGAYMILPEVGAPLDSLQIRFELTQGNDNARLMLGLMTDASMPIYTIYPLDTLTRHDYDTVNHTVNITYQFGNLPAAYKHARIAFWDAFNSYSFLNNIVVEYLPQCTPASNFTVTATTNTATITWANGGDNATRYVVEYGPRYFTPGNGQTDTVTGNTAVLANLNHSTSYDAYVYTVCDNIPAVSIAGQVIRFETECAAFNTLPYTQNFENIVPPGTSPATALPNCWGAEGNGAIPHVVHGSVSTQYGSPEYCFYFNNLGVAALPQMTAPLNTLKISFRDYNADALSNGLIIGTVNNIDSGFAATFVPYDTVDFAANGVTNVVCYLTDYTGTANRIAIRNYSKNGSATAPHYIDDVVVDEAPACVPPQHVHIDYLTGNEANIVWSRSNAFSYSVVYNVHDSATVTTVGTSTRSILLTGLNPQTRYDVAIVGDCSTDTVRMSFTTPCNVVSLPFFENFDSITTSTTSATGAHVDCWDYEMLNSSYTSATYQPQVYYSSSYANSGSYSLRLYGKAYTMLPPMPTRLEGLQMTFFPYKTTADYELVVGVMEGNTFVPYDTINYAVSTHPEVTVKFNNYHGNGRIIAFYNTYGTYGYSYHYIDDVEVDYIPTCPKVDSLHATAVFNNSVELAWNPTGEESQWEVTYNGHDTVVYNNSPVIYGLVADSNYTITVRPICAIGDTGRVRTITIHTTCDPVTLPYTENFDNVITATSNTSSNYGVVPNCWSYIMTGTSSYQTGSYLPKVYYSTTYPHSGNYCLYLYGVSYTMLPPMPTSLDSLQLVFWDYTTGASNGLQVGVMEGNTFIPVETITTPTSTHMEHTVYFAAYTGNSRTIAFRNYYTTSATTYTSSHYIDDVTVDYVPSCAHVVALEVDSASTNSLTIDWTDVTPAIQYLIEYGPAGFTPGTGTTITRTSHPVLVNNLTPSSSYDFYVRAVCSVGDTAEVFGPLTANTECLAVNLPYVQDFNTTPASTYSTAGVLPNCWEGYSNGTNPVYFPHVIGSGSYWYSINSSHSLVMTSGSETYGNVKYVALPVFNQPVNTLSMTFWYRHESASSGTLYAGYLTGSDFSTFVPVKTMTATTTMTRDSVSFAAAPANATRIAFKWSHSSSFYSVGIDDVTVTSSVAACDAPAIVRVTPTETTVKVDYQSESAAVQVAIVPGSWTEPTTGTQVNSDTTYTFQNLDAETQYTVGVRAMCDANHFSEWVTATVTTDRHPCHVPTNVQVTGTTFNSAVVNWTPGENETAWELNVTGTNYDTTYSVTTKPFTVTGLTHAATYSVKVRAMCSENYYSEWSAPQTFSTNSCQGVTNVDYSNVTANSATITWTAPQGVTNFKLEYGESGFSQGHGTMVSVTGTSKTLTGLDPESAYDVYVLSVCAEGVESEWSDALTFTTAQQGIDDVDNASINLYPNPASSTVTLTGIEGKATVTVVDMNGRIVVSAANGNSGEYTVNDGTLTIDVTEMAQGAYFIRIVGEKVNAIRKLIVR